MSDMTADDFEKPGRTDGVAQDQSVSWIVSDTPVAYPDAVAAMERRIAAIAAGTAPETVWLLEHPPLYTAGTSANRGDLLAPDRFPVFETGRGGEFTYHGPGQRVAYVMLDLRRRNRDVRAFVQALERWIIATLAAFDLEGFIREGRIGVWVSGDTADGSARGQATEEKIAAIGIRVRQWISYHGVSLNVAPDLTHFDGIVPCGLPGYGVTSLAKQGCSPNPGDVDAALRRAFEATFALTTSVENAYILGDDGMSDTAMRESAPASSAQR